MADPDRIEGLFARSQTEPRQVVDQLDDLLAEHELSGQRHGRSEIFRCGALAWRVLGDFTRSDYYIEQAIGAAIEVDDRAAQVKALLARAGNTILLGDVDRAITQLDEIETASDPRLEARVKTQLGAFLARAGRRAEAMATFDAVIDAIQPTDERVILAMAHKNRGMLRAQDGQLRDASDDLTVGRELFQAEDLRLEVAFSDHDLALVASYEGDLPTAFRRFERAEAQIREITGNDYESKTSHCRALLAAGLFHDAAELAADAAELCEGANLLLDGAEARMVAATAFSQAGEIESATAMAEQAQAAFEAQGRDTWSAGAQLMLLSLRHRSRLPIDASQLHSIGQRLVAGGHHRDAIEAQLLLAEADTNLPADEALSMVKDLSVGGEQAADIRLAAATVAARIERRAGRVDDAEATARHGFELLHDYQMTLGSADLRVGVREHAKTLFAIGLSTAVERSDPAAIVEWLERDKVASNTARPVLPTADDELGEALGQLRALDSDDPASRRELEDKVAMLARAARGRSGQHGPDARPADGGALDVAGLIAALESPGLAALSFGAIEGQLLAVVIVNGAITVHDLGSVDEVHRLVRTVRHDLRRRALAPSTTDPTRTLGLLAHLDQKILGPLGLPAGPSVIAPTPGLFAVPWHALPSRHGQPVSVATSLSQWAAMGEEHPASDDPTVVIAGPDLEYAAAEAKAIAAAVTGPVRTGDASTTAAEARSMLDGAAVAHLVAHGKIRVDNPLFSALQLGDGDLNVYELQTLARPPRVTVLSACHVGLPAEAPGRELLGLSTGLLASGSASVVASTLPVLDSATMVQLMAQFHEKLAAGLRPAAAWAGLQEAMTELERLDTASFTVFGRG